MLGPREVVPYLQARGCLTASGTEFDGITIEDASRRKRNLKVLRRRGMSYFLKQARDADGAAQLAREASIYQFLRSNVRRDLLVTVFRVLGYDPNKHILVLELIGKSHNLREHHDLKRRFPAALGAALAHALASLHRLPIKDDLVLRSPHGPPWIFRPHRPALRHWRGLSRASLKVIEIIQGSAEFCRLLDDLQQDWRNDAFIHFDARWDNCIVLEPSAPEYTAKTSHHRLGARWTGGYLLGCRLGAGRLPERLALISASLGRNGSRETSRLNIAWSGCSLR